MTDREKVLGFSIFTAILSALAIPTNLPDAVQIFIELVLFSLILFIGIQFLQSRAVPQTILCTLAAIAYNPITLLVYGIKSNVIIDFLTMVVFFGIALKLDRPIEHHIIKIKTHIKRHIVNITNHLNGDSRLHH